MLTDTDSATSRLPNAIRALRHRNFRYYFLGQMISVVGSWIQQVALSWLVYRLTGSAALLGIAAFCALIPQLLIGPFAGAWVDKQDKQKWLIAIEGLLALQGAILSILTWTHLIGPGFLILMSLTLGVLNSFEMPLRQSLISSFVPQRADLTNAIALNAMVFNIGRSIGPPLAGALLALTSEAACFAINGASFLALMIGLVFIKITPPPRATGSMADVFREGVRYAWHAWPVRIAILTLVALNLTASAYSVLLPVFARDVFGGDATTLGWLWGASGWGALASSAILATRTSNKSLVQVLVSGVAISAAALVIFSLSNTLPQAIGAMALLGYAIAVSNVGINMLLQNLAPEHLRGRVISFFTSTRFGFDAIGGLLGGFLATALGAGATLLGEGIVLSLFVAFLLTRYARLRLAVGSGGRHG